MLSTSFLLLLVVSAGLVSAFFKGPKQVGVRSNVVYMGLGDMLKKALANDPSLPPPVNPGLSRQVQF
jgi:hypothetical protein